MKLTMKPVVSATGEMVPHFAYGKVAGSKHVWRCVLECGHKANVRRSGNKPKKAHCRECALAAARGEHAL